MLTTKSAHFDIVKKKKGLVVIRDVGHDKGFRTVTNDAEGVITILHVYHGVPPSDRIFYYDSEGELAEIVERGGGQISFAPATEEQIA